MMLAARILVLAPHPDDEVVACGIAALRARAAGGRVFVLYLTTGVPGDAGGYAARVERRRAETAAAAALLGLEPAGLRTTPARRLRLELDSAAAGVAAAIAACAAEALWVPAFEGGHQDHDAANALAAVFAGRLPVWEFAAYNRAGGHTRTNHFAGRRGDEVAITASPAEAAAKRRALAGYRSERANLRCFGADVEAARPLGAYDYAAPPHPGQLFRERFHWVPFRHPRVDFATSAEIYRDIGGWFSAGRTARPAALGDAPSGEPGQPDRQFAGALDETEGERGVG